MTRAVIGPLAVASWAVAREVTTAEWLWGRRGERKIRTGLFQAEYYFSVQNMPFFGAIIIMAAYLLAAGQHVEFSLHFQQSILHLKAKTLIGPVFLLDRFSNFNHDREYFVIH